jgi:two-component system phosphate regulon response regulator PhoB
VASKGRILLVEDDAALAELLIYHFTREGFEIQQTADGEEAMLLASESAPDLVLLDWMIEGLSGIEVCRRLRRLPDTANVPIIMLTARGEEADRVRGLETGADDYVTKPFSPRELVARVGAVLRRVRPALAGEQLTYADIEMDIVSYKVKRGGATIALGPTEFRLLQAFPRTSRPRFLARAAARQRLGPRQLLSSRAPSTSTSAACARRSIVGGKSDIIRTSARPATRSTMRGRA